MSRLDSFLRRMRAQRVLLDHAAELLGARDGPVVDLGLGAGRTYDHLCALFPDRAVFTFDRRIDTAPGLVPPAERTVVGDIRDTLPFALPRLGSRAALVHNDLGSADPAHNAAVAAWLAPAILAIARPDALVISSFSLPFPAARALPLPAEVPPDRYALQELAV